VADFRWVPFSDLGD